MEGARNDDRELPAGAEVATLGGGCFWCIEAVFDSLEGVSSVESGYTVGNAVNPTYQQICNGDAACRKRRHMTFDPAVISFHEFSRCSFATPRSDDLNRQGNDVGTQIGPRFSITRPPKKRHAEKFIAGMTGTENFSRQDS